MPRGVTLTNLLAMLKATLGENSGTNVAGDSALKVLLSNEQKWLAGQWDWSFMEHRWPKVIPVGTRFIALPTTTATNVDGASGGDLGFTAAINFDRPVTVETYYNGIWYPVENGINSTEFNYLEGTTDVTDPIRKWRLASNTSESSNADQIEVWPLPVTEQTLRFTGQRQLLTLSSGSDKADLDDMLLVFMTAAKLAARRKLPDASLIASQAQERLRQVRAMYPKREVRLVFGENQMLSDRKPVKLVAIGGVP